MGGYYLNSAVGIDIGVAMVALGRPAAALADQHPNPSRWLEANLAFTGGDPGRAAEVFALIGSKPDEADAHLAAARALHAAGRGDEAATHLAEATAFYERVGAVGYLAEARSLRQRLDRD